MEQILSLLQPNQRYTPSVKIHGEDIAELNRQATTYKDKKKLGFRTLLPVSGA